MDEPDYELMEAAEQLEAEGYLEKGTAAYGILQQVIHQGAHSLSPAQEAVYDQHVVPHLKRVFEEWRIQQVLNSNPD